MPCDKCPRRHECREICPALEAMLPKLQDTVTHGHKCADEDLDLVMRKRRLARVAVDRRVHLHGREREVLDMVLNKSMTVKEAASALGASNYWVRKLLQNAFTKMREAGRARRERVRRERRPGG